MRESKEFRINTRKELVKKQNNICAYCRKPMKYSTLEHIIPVNGSEESYENNPDNFIAVCKSCNVSKGDHIIFSNLYDKEIYIMIDVPYFFRANYIQKNKRGIK